MTTNSNPEAGFRSFSPASDSTERLSASRAAECVGLAGPAGETLPTRSPELDAAGIYPVPNRSVQENRRIAGHEIGHVLAMRASLPLDAIRRPRDTPVWKLEAALKCRSCKNGRYAPPVHMIKLTMEREITLYAWLHPDDDDRR